jgi:AcrR family transcriptional regulator
MVHRMTHPISDSQSSYEPASNSSSASASAIAAIVAKPPVEENDEDVTLDQSGRPLGPRALRTRQRILDATVELLSEKSMRDLRVIDIARRIGTSPATFYQYFKDVNDVVLELATEVSDTTSEMIAVIDGDWTGQSGYDRGVKLTKMVVAHWDRYRPILRVRNNAADEGDPRFMEVRRKAMFPLVHAFAEAIRKRQSHATDDATSQDHVVGHMHPISGGMFLFAVLEGMAIHNGIFTRRFGPMGEGMDELVESVAAILQRTLTAPR